MNRAGSVVVLDKEAVRQPNDPDLSLELVPKGSPAARAGGAVLRRDAIRAVHSDGRSSLFEWDGTAFVSSPSAP